MNPPKFLFRHQISIKGYVANNSMGEKIYTNINGIDPTMIISSLPNGDVVFLGRFEPTRGSIRMGNGEEKKYIGAIYTLGTDIPLQSTITFENSKYVVTECVKHFDINGISYLEVFMS
jgi:hypothetical protein